MPNSENNNRQRRVVGEMMGNGISKPPVQNTQQSLGSSIAQNGVGTTAISNPPASPQPSSPIPGSVGTNQIAIPPAPQPTPGSQTRGLGASQIAVPPQQNQGNTNG